MNTSLTSTEAMEVQSLNEEIDAGYAKLGEIEAGMRDTENEWALQDRARAARNVRDGIKRLAWRRDAILQAQLL